MVMKKFIAADNKAAWYDSDKHDLIDGELVLIKGHVVENEPSTIPKKSVKKSSKKARY
jgi:hypothetical protein